ncbi:hypothetical protein Focb16_v005976 [Fusarium oxysporum f. sp. cubense]|uniref:Uncharacterized protein n=1 Tax=Fusarium oxysporum f. sp. cubense TaxID=61366 RepID=A0A559LHP1_FUSOC|nr:hypothetical protein Focb16_v005976 [Fusarium oxysporum f. sp. cubense]
MPTTRRQAQEKRRRGGRMLLALPNEIKAEMRRSTKKEKEQWSPWTLTQLSRDYNKSWQHSYTYLTKHLICPFQLKDYMATCFNDRKDDNVVDKRLRPPVNSIYVRLTAENLIQVPLHEIYQAEAYPKKLQVSLQLGGCGKQQVSKEETNRRHSVFKQLETLIFEGPLRAATRHQRDRQDWVYIYGSVYKYLAAPDAQVSVIESGPGSRSSESAL